MLLQIEGNMPVQIQHTNQYTLKWITELLWEVGIPLNVHGYHYLVEAIQLTLFDPKMSTNLSRQLYPCIAEHYHTSASCIERSIRHAIELAWTRGKLAECNGIFGRNFNLAYEKPTNSEMIALLTEIVRVKIYERRYAEA